MNIFSSNLTQEVINEPAQIFSRICAELEKAEQSVLIASAWFTDPELFSLIKKKSEQGVKVDLIIADNEENKKLDFHELTKTGSEVVRIKNVGYGMMHQKFCVIDNRVAIHGSYNWSLNARKNNHESIIVTDHKQTIQSLVEVFNNIKVKASERNGIIKPGIKGVFQGLLNKSQADDADEDLTELAKLDQLLNEAEARSKKKPETPPAEETPYLQYEKVLDSMISAEVSGFDRPMLRNQGFERSKSNNGDSQVLDTALDSVYSVFINDIDVVDDKKKRLIGKIHEQKVKTADFLQTTLDTQLNKIESDTEETGNVLFQKITNLKSNIGVLEADIKSIQNNKIEPIVENNKRLAEEIKDKEREFIIPKHKTFELIPVATLNFILLTYLILFYSSAAYILIFAENDAKLAQNDPYAALPGVFNPDALSLAWDHGGVAFFFILLFPFLPICISIAERFKLVSDKNANWISLTGIFLIDLFLAVQVSKAIHNVLYERGKVTAPWSWTDPLRDINMYLVLVMGAAGLLIFKVAYKKFMNLFEERNPDINHQKNLLLIQQLKDKMAENIDLIQKLKLEIDSKEKQIIQDKGEIIRHQSELDNLPAKKANEIEKRKNEYHAKLQRISQITDIYISHVENDNLPISVDSLKDRINVFLEGWNDYLHSEFAVLKAVEKSSDAAEIASKWLNTKLTNNVLDKRIKL